MAIVVTAVSAKAEQTLGAAGRPQTFFKEEVSIGRSASNDLVLASPDVSSKHAKFVQRNDSSGRPALFIVDLGSSNGTFIEEQRLQPKDERELKGKERIVLGSFLLTASILDAEATGMFQATKAPKSKDAPKAAANKPDQENKSAPPRTVKGRGRSALYEKELEVKRLVHDKLIERLDLRRKDIVALTDDDLRNRAKTVVEQIILDFRWEIPVELDRDKLIKQVLDEALGLGSLEELLSDEEVSEIMVNSYDMIYAERKGKLTLTDLRFSSERAVLGAIERILAPIGRRIDESSPLVDARLKDGSRVNAVIRPLALRGPCITIRKFSRTPLQMSDLVKFNAVSKGMADFLGIAVETRQNIVISGGTGSGKTTLLNVISSFIPNEQRVITVEDAAELQLPQEHVVCFETRPPNLEGKGAITIRDLVKNALRMRPDRIVVGECRGAETLDMLQAMNTGHDGSMTTGHANTPADMLRRLETMVLMAGLDLPVRAIREQIASAVNIIIQQSRFSCGTRKVTAITEVAGMDYDEGTVVLQDVFVFKQEGFGADGKIKGYHQATGYIPKFFRSLQERGIPVNAKLFSPDNV